MSLLVVPLRQGPLPWRLVVPWWRPPLPHDNEVEVRDAATGQLLTVFRPDHNVCSLVSSGDMLLCWDDALLGWGVEHEHLVHSCKRFCLPHGTSGSGSRVLVLPFRRGMACWL